MTRFIYIVMLIFASLITIKAQETVITDDITGTQYIIEEYVPANFPVGMAFAPDGRLFYNEKTTGNVRVIAADGTQRIEPVINLETDALQERGMLGIAVSPDFENDNFVYVVHTAIGTATNFAANRLVRFTVDIDNNAGDIEELIRIPIETGELLHNGGNVHFDEEGYLYLSVGDYGDAANAQNLDTPQGAIHRFLLENGQLTIPDDNPFTDNSIYAFGYRNPFDFTFDTMSDVIFVAEVGPSCDDEINATQAGDNHGWDQEYECVGTDGEVDIEGYIAPMLSYSAPVIAPTGIVVYDGEAFPDWQGDLFFCNWSYGNLRRAELSDDRTAVIALHEINLGDTTCKLDLVIGADGAFYFGTVGGGGGSIMRMRPVSDED
ncbi:MAG: PQQ-dependent sugar dehydrogenase [Phototrophicaceae bacterium]